MKTENTTRALKVETFFTGRTLRTMIRIVTYKGIRRIMVVFPSGDAEAQIYRSKKVNY
jgi:hypothetical protein